MSEVTSARPLRASQIELLEAALEQRLTWRRDGRGWHGYLYEDIDDVADAVLVTARVKRLANRDLVRCLFRDSPYNGGNVFLTEDGIEALAGPSYQEVTRV